MIPVVAAAAAVLVLEDRARVERRVKVAVAAGASRLRLDGVAPVLADKSVVARAVGAEVVDVRVRREVAPWREGGDDGRAVEQPSSTSRQSSPVAFHTHASVASSSVSPCQVAVWYGRQHAPGTV